MKTSLVICIFSAVQFSSCAAPISNNNITSLGSLVSEFEENGPCDLETEKLKENPKVVTALSPEQDSSMDPLVRAKVKYIVAMVELKEVWGAACQEKYQKGISEFTENYEDNRKTFIDSLTYELSADEDIRKVQKIVQNLAIADQSARNTWSYFNNNISTENYTRVGKEKAAYLIKEADIESSEYLSSMLQNIDWFSKDEYGPYTSFLAWSLIQHADQNPDLQKLALSRIKPLLDKGEASKSDYAFLYDRVAVNSGQKQLYGTQGTGNCENGKVIMQPLLNPANIDKLRSQMDLEAYESYKSSLSKISCLTNEAR